MIKGILPLVLLGILFTGCGETSAKGESAGLEKLEVLQVLKESKRYKGESVFDSAAINSMKGEQQ